MKMKRIANNVALQTIGYVISGFTNVYIYVRECGYQKRDIYRGLYKHFAHDEMNKYAYCKISIVDTLGAMRSAFCAAASSSVRLTVNSMASSFLRNGIE